MLLNLGVIQWENQMVLESHKPRLSKAKLRRIMTAAKQHCSYRASSMNVQAPSIGLTREPEKAPAWFIARRIPMPLILGEVSLHFWLRGLGHALDTA